MIKDLGHGPRIDDGDYDRKIIELYSKLPPNPTRDQYNSVRRAEFQLAIDHRLGINFPADRREMLSSINDRVDRKRLRLIFKYLLRKIFTGWFVSDVRKMTNFMIDEYAGVLNNDELESFFNFQNGKRPSLPIDMEQLKKP